MVIIMVRSSRENAMLSTVKPLRRLLRNAFLTMKVALVIATSLSDVAEAIHNIYLRGVVRRNRRAQQPHHAGNHDCQQNASD